MLEMALPDRHRALRSAMLSAFRGASLASLAEVTRDSFDQLLALAGDGGVVDFVDAFAQGVASSTTAELLGARSEEAERLEPVFNAFGSLDVDTSSQSAAARRKTELWLLRELTRLVRARRERERSGEGLVEMLLAAEVDGQPLSEQEAVLNCLNVVVAGTGAMQHSLAAAVAVWMEQGVDLEGLAAEPESARRLVDETLRWLTPVVHLTRIAASDVEVSGQLLPKGAGICLWNVSANRDEEIFEDPGVFDPSRPAGRHLAFGAGPQHCLGAHLVQAQLRHLLAAILEHGVRFEAAGPPTWVRSNTITGVERLPLRVCRGALVS
jgi:cytochrome P450